MNFSETGLAGAFVVDIEPVRDARGFFARTWCRREALEHGVDIDFVQFNVSHNLMKGTLRGMHYQAPAWEAKLVRVTRGAVLDVIVDLRPTSETYKQHFAVELNAENRRMLYIPEGFAHGFLALEDDTEIFYQMSAYYIADQARGFRWDDPQFALPWPAGEKILSERDQNLPLYELQPELQPEPRREP